MNSQPIEIQTSNGGVPIRCFTDRDLLPDQAARCQLEHVATVPGLDRYVVVLPDVHCKARNPSPTGTVVVSQDVILPRAIDPGINCGMRIIRSEIPVRELKASILDELFRRLREAIPLLEPHARPLLTVDECERMLVYGLPEAGNVLELGSDDLARIENGGRMMPELAPDEIRAVVTVEAIRKGNPWLGTLGAGNHFLELQEIVEILDGHAARRLGLEKGCAVFMLHSDSRRLGKKIMKPLREEASTTRRSDSSNGLWTTSPDNGAGRRFVSGLAAASHAGFANRAALTQILRCTARQILADQSLALPLVFDCGHETIQRERHNGQWLWVHRHGASRAVPAAGFASDPVLGELGQPVPIPGSMGTDSYLGVAQPGVDATFRSVAHGAGRVMEKSRAAEQFGPLEVEDELRKRSIRLYRYGADNIAGQAPASFKDVHRVVEAMTDFALIRPVVRLRPVAVLKG
jgi:tRNA-splicing ligase RtcB